MNKHSKLAIMIAPLLIVIGYIASDYYIEFKAEGHKLFELKSEGDCQILEQKCILKSGDFKINIFDEDGITTINSTFPLDSAALFVVLSDEKVIPYTLSLVDNPYYWNSKTIIREALSTGSENLKLRLIATVKGGKYISEFTAENHN